MSPFKQHHAKLTINISFCPLILSVHITFQYVHQSGFLQDQTRTDAETIARLQQVKTS